MIGKMIVDGIAKNVERRLAKKTMDALSPYVDEFVDEIFDSVVNGAPNIRSTGGATQSCLDKIQNDFHDFHYEDANSSIQTFIVEYLQIKYAGKKEFEKSNISPKILIDVGDKGITRLSNVKINQIAIADYIKSQNSATILYRVSVGFDAFGERKEKLYEVEYTLQLRDEFGEQKFLKCDNCGAPLNESSGECEYCGMKHIRDTIESWFIIGIKER